MSGLDTQRYLLKQKTFFRPIFRLVDHTQTTNNFHFFIDNDFEIKFILSFVIDWT